MHALRFGARRLDDQIDIFAIAHLRPFIAKPEKAVGRKTAALHRRQTSGSSVTSMYFDIGVKLLTACSSMPTSTLVSGK